MIFYISFDVNKEEVIISSRKSKDSTLFKVFNFSKMIPNEKFDYTFLIDNKGNLSKGIRGNNSSFNKGEIILYHNPKIHKTINISLIDKKNIITYKEFINAEFKSFFECFERST